jgi:putative aldouronate transport system substrate-binding protein
MNADRQSGRQTSRREFLWVTAGGVVVTAVAGPMLLEACTRAGGGTTTTNSAAVKLPTFVQFNGPPPDVAPKPNGVQAGWFTYPKKLVKSVKEAPLKGSQVTAQVPSFTNPPTPMASNAYWQEFNRQVGGTVTPNITSGNADYTAKVNTIMAGGDLPDYLHIPFSQGILNVPHLAEFLTAKCQDLTPYLSGDAVKDYPNLANLPTYAWKTAVIANAIFGLPVARSNFSNSHLFVQQNRLDQVGISQPKNADEFMQLMKQLTRPQQNQWGIGSHTNQPAFGIGFFQQLFRAPNNWKLGSNGKLTKDWEAEESKSAVAYVKQLYDAGVFLPGSANGSPTQAKVDYISGKMSSVMDTWSAYGGYWTRALNQTAIPGFKVRVMLPFGHDGGRPIYFSGTGGFGVAFMKKSSPDRVRELLRFANYLSAPFGTEEYLFQHSGVQGVHFNYDASGNPVQTSKGVAENQLNLGYVSSPPDVIYNSQTPTADYVRTAHDQEEALAPLAVADPTIGLYSATAASKGATLNQAVIDRLNDIITGRAPISAYDEMVSSWKTNGGDTIRKEYQDALQKAGHA